MCDISVCVSYKTSKIKNYLWGECGCIQWFYLCNVVQCDKLLFRQTCNIDYINYLAQFDYSKASFLLSLMTSLLF